MKTIKDLKFKYNDPNNLNVYPKEVINKLLHKFLPITLNDYIKKDYLNLTNNFRLITENESIGEAFINKIDDDDIYFDITIKDDEMFEMLSDSKFSISYR